MLGDGAGGFQVEELVDPAAGTAAVGLADHRPHVAVLDGQRDKTAWLAGDMPGQCPPEPGDGQGTVRIVRDRGVSASPEGAGVDPGGELLDPVANSSPGPAMASRTRTAAATSGTATQGASLSTSADTWLPSVSLAVLNCRA